MPAASPTADEAREADVVDGDAGGLARDAAGERGAAAGVLPVRGLEDVAEHDVVRLQPGSTVEGGAHRRGAELDAAVLPGRRGSARWASARRRRGRGLRSRPPAARIRRLMELLVIGAGPYGLAVAAEARRQGLSVTVVGEPMRFWRRNMPDGMLLRSGREWHLDAAGVHTFDAFTGGWDGEPIPVETFIAYADWFASRRG